MAKKLKFGEFPGFKACIAMLRKHDHQISEDGYFWLMPRVDQYLEELIIEFKKEENHRIAYWLLELIAEIKITAIS